MVTGSSTIVNKLLPQVKKILLSEPIDVVEDDGQALYECWNWELTKPRQDGSTKIGSANFMICNNLVIKELHSTRDPEAIKHHSVIFQTLLSLLEAERQIRQPPHEKRKGFKIVDDVR